MRIHQPSNDFVCLECNKSFRVKEYLSKHMRTHRPSNDCVLCPECGKSFAQMRYLTGHMKTHDIVHPNMFDGKIIMLNDAKDGFAYAEYVDDPSGEQDIRHIVCIPWYDTNGNYVNVSVGFTKYSDIKFYAKQIWVEIKQGIDDGSLYLSGCGSGRLAVMRLHWEMHPEKSFALGICIESQVIANRVKGYIRQLLDSVYILSADDKNNLLRPCYGVINGKIRDAFRYLSAHNINAFHANLSGVGQHCSFRLNVTANRQFKFDELEIDM